MIDLGGGLLMFGHLEARMRRLGLVVLAASFVMAVGAVPGCDCSNGSMSSFDFSSGGDLSVGDLAGVDAAVGDAAVGDGGGGDGGGASCGGAGVSCAHDAECCSNLCDPSSHVCVLTRCGQVGAACASAKDCCGLACVGSQCASAMCISDGQPCTSGASCCSTICGVNGTCTPLNTMCSTAGNECAMDGDCCSGSCLGVAGIDGGTIRQCAAPSQVSYCTQVGDICSLDADCCTGVCNLVGASVGVCAAISTSCSVDGTTCNGCGTCCSHFCGPFGSAGSSICQPASGCHVQGDTCRTSGDCCGGDAASGLPGAGLVACTPDPTYPTKIGTCSKPNKTNCPPGTPGCNNTCDPAGDVCHLNPTPVCAGGTTNVRDDCCACISTKSCCQPDKVGIPRCNLVGACVPAGGNCSFNGDCCNGLPCVPDATGALHCGSMCVPQGGFCTTNADCCIGLNCIVPPGSIQGACDNLTPPPDMGPPVDLASHDLAGADLKAPPDLAQVCAQYGQACSTTQKCCDAVQCTNTSFQPCGPTDTNCSCFSPIP